jgi:hypothetical protein
MFDASPPPEDPPPEHPSEPRSRRLPPDPQRAHLHAALDRLLDARAGDGGPALAAAIEASDDLRRAAEGALVEVISAFDASMHWAAEAHRSPVSWLVSATGQSRRGAASMRRTCLDAAARPHLAAAASAGALSHEHLRLLADARCAPLEDQFDLDEADLVEAACTRTVDALRVHLRRWRYDALARLGRNEPDGPEPPAPDGNVLRLSPLLDGRAKLDAELDPLAAATIRNGIDAELDRLRAAGALDADPRSLRELEADLFVAIFERGLARPDGAAPAPLVLAAVDLDTVLDRAGVATPAERTARRAELIGHGPVSDDAIAELLDRADLALLITHPGTGHPLWFGRTRRLATTAQRHAVLATSSPHCDFPGCTVGVHRCQIDHLTSWDDRGPTDVDNLRALCRFHNPLKHRRQITATAHPDGTTTYATPDGRPIAPRYAEDP